MLREKTDVPQGGISSWWKVSRNAGRDPRAGGETARSQAPRPSWGTVSQDKLILHAKLTASSYWVREEKSIHWTHQLGFSSLTTKPTAGDAPAITKTQKPAKGTGLTPDTKQIDSKPEWHLKTNFLNVSGIRHHFSPGAWNQSAHW